MMEVHCAVQSNLTLIKVVLDLPSNLGGYVLLSWKCPTLGSEKLVSHP